MILSPTELTDAAEMRIFWPPVASPYPAVVWVRLALRWNSKDVRMIGHES